MHGYSLVKRAVGFRQIVGRFGTKGGKDRVAASESIKRE